MTDKIVLNKNWISLIVATITILSVLSSVVAYNISIKKDLDYTQEEIHNLKIENNNLNLEVNSIKLEKKELETKIDLMRSDISEIKSDVKTLIKGD